MFQSSLMHSYRALLAKVGSKGYLEEPGSMVHHAKAKIWTGVRPRSIDIGVDPKGAFARLRTAVLAAKSEGKRRAEEQLKKALPQTLLRKKAGVPSEFGEMFGENGITRAVMLFAIASMSRAFMQGATKTNVEGAEIFKQALNRPKGQPLITVSNHVASLDDPLVVAALTPASIATQPENIRWTLCAKDRCFSNPLFSGFFKALKVLPVERGGGLKQLGMRAAEYQLNQGEWVHIFPEGTRSRNGNLLPIRPGVGRLVAACENVPLVVPFVHSGMDKVMPKGASLPRPGQTVNVLVGEPIEMDDLIRLAKERNWSESDFVAAITHRIGQQMAILWSQLESTPVPTWALKSAPQPSSNRTREFWRDLTFKWPWCMGLQAHMAASRAALALERKKQEVVNAVNKYFEFCSARTMHMEHIVQGIM